LKQEQSLNTPKKKNLGSYRSGIVILSVTLALSIIGFFMLVVAHADALITKVKEDIELHAYLEHYVNETDKLKIKKIIENQDFVNLNLENPVVFVSQEKLANELIEKESLQENYQSVLGYDPIRSCYVVKIKPELTTKSNLEKIKSTLEAVTGIYEVDLSYRKAKDIELVITNLNNILIFLLVFTAFSILAISLLISNTIKLALFSQRFLIRSMQLIGAEHQFIRRPFLKNAIIQGAAGGFIASLITYFSLNYIYTFVDSLSELLNTQIIFLILGGLVTLGALIGFISALLALNKYLKMSLDDLY